MLAIALKAKPHAACIVPEKREERTTEGGIDAAGQHNRLAPLVRLLGAARIRVSMFIEPDKAQLDASRALGAPVVELHTGAYAEAGFRGDPTSPAAAGQDPRDLHAMARPSGWRSSRARPDIWQRQANCRYFGDQGAQDGYLLIGEAIFSGLDASIRRMRALMDEARPKQTVATQHDHRHRLRPHRYPPRREEHRTLRRAVSRAHIYPA
jgi:pyridoxine 5-phosphate synthase